MNDYGRTSGTFRLSLTLISPQGLDLLALSGPVGHTG
jgi:hypothetical protein